LVKFKHEINRERTKTILRDVPRLLTSKYEQYVHTAETNTVENTPAISPAKRKACGMARIPVPRDALSK